MESEQSFDLQIPSVLGFEKVVIDFAASVGKIIHLPAERIEDLKTAVAEACTNAIEHGNKMQPSAKVSVSFTIEEAKLQVAVQDEGTGIGQITPPSLEQTIAGKKERPRGWGIFLIKNLMDEVEFETRPGHWNMVRMVVRLQE